jgi:hypothetical protein
MKWDLAKPKAAFTIWIVGAITVLMIVRNFCLNIVYNYR